MHHPAWQTSGSGSWRNRGRDALQCIAVTLGCPAERLMRSAYLETYPDETAELVRLWFKIEDPTVRRTLLAEVRKASIR